MKLSIENPDGDGPELFNQEVPDGQGVRIILTKELLEFIVKTAVNMGSQPYLCIEPNAEGRARIIRPGRF